MEKIVFLDRDGTLNEEVNYLHRPEDMHLLAGGAGSFEKLKEPDLSWWWSPIRPE